MNSVSVILTILHLILVSLLVVQGRCEKQLWRNLFESFFSKGLKFSNVSTDTAVILQERMSNVEWKTYMTA